MSYFNKQTASVLCVYMRCPTTGRTIDGDRGDDKVICYCPDAASRGNTHLVRNCAASTVEQYMLEHDLTDALPKNADPNGVLSTRRK